MSGGFLINLLVLINIYCILAVSFNLTLGYTGLINLGHIAFYAIGAYTAGIMTKTVIPFFIPELTNPVLQLILFVVVLLLAGMMSMTISYLLTYFIRKLKGDYLAMATLSFTLATHNILLTFDSLTSGTQGIPGIARPVLFKSNWVFLIAVTLVTVLSVYLIRRVVHSPFGNVLQAVRDDEVLVRSLGKDSFRLKTKAMAISGFFAGIAGAIFAFYITFIHPDFFNLNEMIIILTIVIIGGLASIKGTIIASFIIISLPDFIRLIDIPQTILGPMRLILYGLLLLVILRLYSRGLFGKVDLHDY